MSKSKTWLKNLLLMPSIALCVIWYAHVLHTELGDPLGLPFDRALWGISSLIKVATQCTVAFLLAIASSRINRAPHLAGKTIARWAVLCVLTMLLASLSRGIWAPILSNGAIIYYDAAGPAPPGMDDSWANWRWAWSYGLTMLVETGFLIGIGVCCILVAAAIGHLKLATVISCYTIAFASAILFCVSTGWFVLDYDNFHGDVFMSAVALDHIVLLFASDPYTSISALAYLLISVFLYTIPAASPRPAPVVSESTQSTSADRGISNPYAPPQH